MKLQPNEKRLLLILAFVSIVALSFQYLILPEFKRGQEISASNENLASAYNLLVDKDGKASEIEKEYRNANRLLDNVLNSELSEYLGDEELDQYYTNMAIKHGLKPFALGIEYPADAKNLENIKEVYVSLDVSGSMEQLLAFMRDVESKGFMKVQYVDTVRNDKVYDHNIKIEIIMLKG